MREPKELKACGWIFAAAMLAAATLVPVLLPRAERAAPAARPQPIARARPPLAPRLLFILVDGMGADSALAPGWMPRLQARLERSAHGVALASFPTLTPNGLRALLSGRTGVPEPVFLGGLSADWEIDSVLSRASAAGRRVFAVGQQDWTMLFKGHTTHLDIVPYVGASGDEEVLRRARRALQAGDWDFLSLHLFDLDGIGHHTGVGSAEYRRKLLWLDERIAELAQAAGSQTAVLVVSDHGQSLDGSHGGMEMPARRAAFFLWGPGVRPADLGVFPQRDAAPTLAALLGLPPPILSEGQPRWEALALSSRDRASAELDLLEQRSRRWLAAKSEWPWLKADPSSRLPEAQGLWQAGRFQDASDLASRCVAEVDHELQEHSPAQWAGRLTWMLWLLVFAAAFGAAWPRSRAWVQAASATLAGLCLVLLACPLEFHSLWPVAVAWGLVACAGLLGLSLSSGLGSPALSWTAWLLWWLALCGLAFQNLVDAALWSWAALGLLLASRLLRPGSQSRPAAMAAATMGLCALVSCWTAGTQMSALRGLLPVPDLRRLGTMPWSSAELAVVCGLFAFLYRRLRRSWQPAAAIPAAILAAAPLTLALLPWPEELRRWVWALCLVSMIAACLAPLARLTKAFWLSLAVLAFCRTQTAGSQACLLALATLAGWRWAELEPAALPLWQGLALVGFCLWSYVWPGGRLDFSHISVAEGYAGMGEVWHPHLLALLVALKPAAFFLAPVLALLCAVPASAFLGASALLGSFCAGSLTVLWFDKFYFVTGTPSLVDTAGYERLLWAAVLAWLLLAAWSGLKVLLSIRDSSPA